MEAFKQKDLKIGDRDICTELDRKDYMYIKGYEEAGSLEDMQLENKRAMNRLDVKMLRELKSIASRELNRAVWGKAVYKRDWHKRKMKIKAGAGMNWGNP